MRIVHLTQTTTLEVTGGLEHHIAYLADALKQRGHEVEVVSAGSVLIEDPMSPRVMALKHFVEGLSDRRLSFLPRSFRWPFEWLLEFATMVGRRLFKSLYTSRIVRRVRALDPDVVHQHSYLGGLSVCRQLVKNYPVVFTNHTGAYLHLDRSSLFRPLQRWLMTRFTIVIGPSQELLPSTKNGRYIPNGVDLRQFHPVSDEEVVRLKVKHGCAGKRVFICPRRWAPTKGVIYLAQALALLSQETRQKSVFLFAGNETHGYSRYQQNVRWAMREAADCDARILGNLGHSQLAELMNISTACIIPSIMEATSLACLEAMGCGTPVIATNTGGLPEMISHGENGWLVPMRDPAALAATVDEIVKIAPADLLRMRMAAHQIAREHYTWDATAQKTEAVYLEARQSWEHRRSQTV